MPTTHQQEIANFIDIIFESVGDTPTIAARKQRLSLGLAVELEEIKTAVFNASSPDGEPFIVVIERNGVRLVRALLADEGSLLEEADLIETVRVGRIGGRRHAKCAERQRRSARCAGDRNLARSRTLAEASLELHGA
jgi:hypothetical protein